MFKNIFFFLALMAFASGCINETSPVIPCLSCEDSGGGPGPVGTITKKVLIEEFTGVRCVNCPQGSAEIENLIAIHEDKLVAISIHAGFFSNPYSESLFDFRTPDGNNLETFLGPVSSFPAAVVDRTIFDGESSMVVGQASWSSFIAAQLAEPPAISVEVLPEYNPANRALTITVSGTAQSELAHDIFLTVLLTETDIVDYQLKPEPEGKVGTYVHKHVLRDVLTPSNGSNIAPSLAIGEAYVEFYNYTLPADWDADNCSIVAYIHRNDSEKTILQVESFSATD